MRHTILRTAEEVFTQRDYHTVQMDDVAAACGIGKGTLYRQFPSKRALYLAVVLDGITRLRAELTAVLRTPEPPVRQIEHVVGATLAFFWDRLRFFALIHQHEEQPDDDTRAWFRQRVQLTRLVEGALDRAVVSGHLRPVDTRIATEMLFGMMRAANRYRRPSDRRDDLVAAVLDLFMHGVATPAGRRALSRPRTRRN